MEQHILQPESARLTPRSSSGSISSPTISIWSRGHSSKSSSSSMASSPRAVRDSFDLMYGSSKKLEDVREEPQERDDGVLSHSEFNTYDGFARDSTDGSHSPYSPISNLEYSLGDDDMCSAFRIPHQQPRRQRSFDYTRRGSMQQFTSRFGSISSRWKNRSGAGPHLSIITHSAIPQRSASDTPAHPFGRSLGLLQRYDSHLPPTPTRSVIEEPISESVEVPLVLDTSLQSEEPENEGHATTPLLPPIMTDLKRHESPVQSPLQSPSIAPTSCIQSGRPSMDRTTFGNLPSPPLSEQPSYASMPRARTNTVSHEIPPLYLNVNKIDEWSDRLGHADFYIHPEPYMPEILDLDSFKEFRANWEQARKSYSQHLARTTEHYGQTSRVFKLTEEKWKSIDDTWKEFDGRIHRVLSPSLSRLSGGAKSPDSTSSSFAMDKPVTRIVVPTLDNTGKFPDLGDADIVGTMIVAEARVPELQRGVATPPGSPRRRSLFKALSDIFARHG